MAQKADFDPWCLEFPWCLELGIWSLPIGHRPASLFTSIPPRFSREVVTTRMNIGDCRVFGLCHFFQMSQPKTRTIPNKDGPCHNRHNLKFTLGRTIALPANPLKAALEFERGCTMHNVKA